MVIKTLERVSKNYYYIIRGEIYNEGKIFCKAYLREMQGYQEKRKRQNYLRESET